MGLASMIVTLVRISIYIIIRHFRSLYGLLKVIVGLFFGKAVKKISKASSVI